jgi:hypothetical protein
LRFPKTKRVILSYRASPSSASSSGCSDSEPPTLERPEGERTALEKDPHCYWSSDDDPFATRY